MDEIITELTENEALHDKGKHRTLDETITIQAMLCVLISIAFIVSNMFMPDIAVKLSYSLEEACFSETADGFAEKILDFINSKPVSYD